MTTVLPHSPPDRRSHGGSAHVRPASFENRANVRTEGSNA